MFRGGWMIAEKLDYLEFRGFLCFTLIERSI